LFGNRIRQLREEKQMLQRQFAAVLEIDTPMFSKIERDERQAKREQVITIAKLLKINPKRLLTL
jgi:transcriptional regulator with XRE-family HTH domain